VHLHPARNLDEQIVRYIIDCCDVHRRIQKVAYGLVNVDVEGRRQEAEGPGPKIARSGTCSSHPFSSVDTVTLRLLRQKVQRAHLFMESITLV
jgi:hypothetical protein